MDLAKSMPIFMPIFMLIIARGRTISSSSSVASIVRSTVIGPECVSGCKSYKPLIFLIESHEVHSALLWSHDVCISHVGRVFTRVNFTAQSHDVYIKIFHKERMFARASFCCPQTTNIAHRESRGSFSIAVVVGHRVMTFYISDVERAFTPPRVTTTLVRVATFLFRMWRELFTTVNFATQSHNLYIY